MSNSPTSSANIFGKPPKEGYLVQAKRDYCFGPKAIRFRRRTVRGSDRFFVRALRVNADGSESFASASDIGSVVNRAFFQIETDCIAWDRLRLWLDGSINTYQAAVCPIEQLHQLVAPVVTESVKPT